MDSVNKTYKKPASHLIFIVLMSVLYVFFMGWFLKLWAGGQKDGAENLWTNLYLIIALAGGIYGLFVSCNWSGFKSVVGKSIIFFSLGLLTWGIGLAIWLFYNLYLGVEVPYPSWADAAFLMISPFWIIGMGLLTFAVRADFGVKRMKGKSFFAIAPILAVVFSYYLLVIVAREGALIEDGDYLKIFFDLYYVISDIAILTAAALFLVFSYKYLGGRYKTPVYLIVAAFIFSYFADFIFAYSTTTGTYYNGDFSDMLYVTAMFVFGIGLAGFSTAGPKDEKFGIFGFNLSDEKSVFHRIVLEIVKKQEFITGSNAWDEANRVDGLSVNRRENSARISGDEKEIINRLVDHYEGLFGKASREVCRAAARNLIKTMPLEKIPESLR